jgi:hypothetical protein
MQIKDRFEQAIDREPLPLRKQTLEAQHDFLRSVPILIKILGRVVVVSQTTPEPEPRLPILAYSPSYSNPRLIVGPSLYKCTHFGRGRETQEVLQGAFVNGYWFPRHPLKCTEAFQEGIVELDLIVCTAYRSPEVLPISVLQARRRHWYCHRPVECCGRETIGTERRGSVS